MALLNGITHLFTTMQYCSTYEIITELDKFMECFVWIARSSKRHLLTIEVLDTVLTLADFIYEYATYLRINSCVTLIGRDTIGLDCHLFVLSQILLRNTIADGEDGIIAQDENRDCERRRARVNNCNMIFFMTTEKLDNYRLDESERDDYERKSRQTCPAARKLIFTNPPSQEEQLMLHLNDLLHNKPSTETHAWILKRLEALVLEYHHLTVRADGHNPQQLFLEEVFLYCTLVDFTKVLQAARGSFAVNEVVLEDFLLNHQEIKAFINTLTENILKNSKLPKFMASHLFKLQKETLEILQELVTLCESGFDYSDGSILHNVDSEYQIKQEQHSMNFAVNTIESMDGSVCNMERLTTKLKLHVLEETFFAYSNVVFEQVLTAIEFVVSSVLFMNSSQSKHEMILNYVNYIRTTAEAIHKKQQECQKYSSNKEDPHGSQRSQRILDCLDEISSFLPTPTRLHGNENKNKTKQLDDMSQIPVPGRFHLNIYSTDTEKTIMRELHRVHGGLHKIPVVQFMTDLENFILGKTEPLTNLVNAVNQMEFSGHALCTLVVWLDDTVMLLRTRLDILVNLTPITNNVSELSRFSQLKITRITDSFMHLNINYMKMKDTERVTGHFPLRKSLNVVDYLHKILRIQLSCKAKLEARRSLFQDSPDSDGPVNSLWSKIDSAADPKSIENITPASECPVCVSSVVSALLDNCPHLFCVPCLQRWFDESGKNICPLCRSLTFYWTSVENFLSYKRRCESNTCIIN